MTEAALRLKEEVLSLSDEDRHELAIILWDSIGYLPPDDDGEWEVELDRRCNDLDAGIAIAEPFRDAIEKLRREPL